jgi:hypothetical protein
MHVSKVLVCELGDVKRNLCTDERLKGLFDVLVTIPYPVELGASPHIPKVCGLQGDAVSRIGRLSVQKLPVLQVKGA